MQLSIGEVVIVHATPDQDHHLHHLLPLLHLKIKKVMTARSTYYRVKVAVIQDSKLTPKSKNPCIQNYTTVRKDRPHGLDGGLLIFIHRSVTVSKQPLSAGSQYDLHLEELAIEVEIGNTKLIISNIYIPPASSCSNGYQSSIETF